MVMRKLKITRHNHNEYDSITDTIDYRWDDALAAMMDVNDVLDEELSSYHSQDWGGRYASFLNSIGIDHTTDNGWWNLTSINPENIQLFIDFTVNDMEAEEDYDYSDLSNKIYKVKHAVSCLGDGFKVCAVNSGDVLISDILEGIGEA
jgi:hypothetical protein